MAACDGQPQLTSAHVTQLPVLESESDQEEVEPPPLWPPHQLMMTLRQFQHAHLHHQTTRAEKASSFAAGAVACPCDPSDDAASSCYQEASWASSAEPSCEVASASSCLAFQAWPSWNDHDHDPHVAWPKQSRVRIWQRCKATLRSKCSNSYDTIWLTWPLDNRINLKPTSHHQLHSGHSPQPQTLLTTPPCISALQMADPGLANTSFWVPFHRA